MCPRQRFDRSHSSFLIIVSFLALAVFMASGCAPLRKKFIRQKSEKEKEAAFVPVLDPIEYPTRQESPVETYKYHYSLWKVWDKDLLQTLETDGSDKREVYLINQSMEQMEAMNELLSDESKERFSVLINDLRDILGEYDKPEQFRSKFSLQSKIRRYGRKVREQYAPERVFTSE